MVELTLATPALCATFFIYPVFVLIYPTVILFFTFTFSIIFCTQPLVMSVCVKVSCQSCI